MENLTFSHIALDTWKATRSGMPTIQTGPEQLKVRIQTKGAGEEARVWELLKGRVQSYFVRHNLENVQITLAPEPRSGKFRHVWVEFSDSTASLEIRQKAYAIA